MPDWCMQVLAINTIAPFVLNAKLKPLMAKTEAKFKFIVNVSAVSPPPLSAVSELSALSSQRYLCDQRHCVCRWKGNSTDSNQPTIHIPTWPRYPPS